MPYRAYVARMSYISPAIDGDGVNLCGMNDLMA
jgi:hypothetical protein